ncbi:transposable element Tc1 transposase [Trichonephila clavipes]|nr:transposable element Tc1 transposase [Trichonephila clavipes]
MPTTSPLPSPLGYRGHSKLAKKWASWSMNHYFESRIHWKGFYLPPSQYGRYDPRPVTEWPRRRKGAKFELISEFERGRIVGLRKAGLSYRAVAARVQRNSSTIMRVSKQWTDEGRTARKSGSGPRNVTSVRDDRRLV